MGLNQIMNARRTDKFQLTSHEYRAKLYLYMRGCVTKMCRIGGAIAISKTETGDEMENLLLSKINSFPFLIVLALIYVCFFLFALISWNNSRNESGLLLFASTSKRSRERCWMALIPIRIAAKRSWIDVNLLPTLRCFRLSKLNWIRRIGAYKEDRERNEEPMGTGMRFETLLVNSMEATFTIHGISAQNLARFIASERAREQERHSCWCVNRSRTSFRPQARALRLMLGISSVFPLACTACFDSRLSIFEENSPKRSSTLLSGLHSQLHRSPLFTSAQLKTLHTDISFIFSHTLCIIRGICLRTCLYRLRWIGGNIGMWTFAECISCNENTKIANANDTDIIRDIVAAL